MPTELFEAAGLEESVRGRGSTEQDRAKLVVEVGESLGGAPYLPGPVNHTHIDSHTHIALSRTGRSRLWRLGSPWGAPLTSLD